MTDVHGITIDESGRSEPVKRRRRWSFSEYLRHFLGSRACEFCSGDIGGGRCCACGGRGFIELERANDQ